MMRDTDITQLNALEVRVSVMETIQKDTSKTVDHHFILIDRLSTQNTDMTLALKEISSKFDKLIGQISVGFKVSSAAFLLVTTLVGGFWVYNQYVESHFTPVYTTTQQK